jgi:5'-3' exonuclease
MKLANPTLPPSSTCLVDLTGFIHRLAYTPGPHGLDPRTITSKKTGEPTWGLVGAFNQLSTLAKLKPARIIAFADSSQNGFRQQLLDTYKKKSGSAYLGQQLARLAQCLPLMGIPVIGAKEEFPGMEAEDLISKAALVLDGNAVVVSYDKDLLQLVGQPAKDKLNSEVFYYNPQKKLLLGHQSLARHIRTDYNFPMRADIAGPDFAVYLAVTGDSVDGIKSVGGVGEITLAKYYEKLPMWISNPEKIEALAKIDQETKAAEGKQVTADWRRALVNLQLTDLRTSRQLSLAIAGDIPQPAPDKAAFRQVLEDLTMSSFLKQYDNWFAPFEAFQEPLAEPQELAIA